VTARTNIGSLIACAALLAAGCGSDEEGKELPAASVTELNRQLAFIERAVDVPSAGSCRSVLEGSQPNRARVESILDELPTDVDPELRDATRDSFERLFELVEQECQDREQDESRTDTETETTPPETETETTDTETTPTETETTPVETLPLEAPKQKKPKQQNGNGNSGEGGGSLAPGQEGD
jgi:hypothetical protein